MTGALALLLLPVLPARAEWVESSKVKYEATTEKEIRELIERFPDRLGREKADGLSYLSLERTKYRWVGESSCPSSDDPRLFLEDFSTESRAKPGADGRMPASGGSQSLTRLGDTDPCAGAVPSRH